MTVTLRAKWRDARTLFDISNMQDVSSVICENTPTATDKTKINTTPNNTIAEARTGNYIAQTILTDRRDGKTYLVRKYSNGECWMAQNLEFDFKGPSGNYATNTTTSAKADGATLGPDNLADFIALSDIEDETTFYAADNAYAQNKFYITQSAAANINAVSGVTYSWTMDNFGAHSFSQDASGGMKYIDFLRDGSGNIQTGGDGYYLFQTTNNTLARYQKIGNYYDYVSATAGYMGSVAGEQNNSICPRNWQLPANTGSKSFKSLIDYYYAKSYVVGRNNTELYNWMNDAPLNFFRTGLYRQATGNSEGYTNDGAYRSRENKDLYNAYYWNTYIDWVDPNNQSLGRAGHFNPNYLTSKLHGFQVRCVAR